MDQSFYIGAVGAHQQLRHLNILGDNIANVNTYGFKADKARFASLMYQEDPRTTTGEEQLRGVGTRVIMTSTDFNPGGVASTGRSLDYMIDGNGFFALADLATGEISYTRNGAFVMAERLEPTDEVDEEGNPLVDGEGNPVMGSVFYLSDGEGRFVLSNTGGLIEVTDPTQRLPIGIFDYRNYDGMIQLDDTRYMPVDKNGPLLVGSGQLVQGVLEMSNSDLADQFTKVIEAQRAYGMALKIVQTSDEIETTINGLRS